MNIFAGAWERFTAAIKHIWHCIAQFFICLFTCEGACKEPDRNRQLVDHLLGQYRDEFAYATHPTGGETAVDKADFIVARIQQLLDKCFGPDGTAAATLADVKAVATTVPPVVAGPADTTAPVQPPATGATAATAATPANVTRIATDAAPTGGCTDTDDEITRRRWEWAYEIERLLVYVKPRAKLAIDVDRRVDDAKRAGLPIADKYRAQLDAIDTRITSARAALSAAATQLAAKPDDNALKTAKEQAEKQLQDEEQKGERDRRAILAAVLDELQWQSQKTTLVRSALWDSASNLLCFGIMTMLIVAFPFICFVLERWFEIEWFSDLLEDIPNYGLYTAMSFGLLGAYFSRLTSLTFAGNLTLEDAENRYSYASLVIRAGVGASGALLFYFLMRTGVIGSIAPNFDNFTYTAPNMKTVLTPQGIDVLIPSKDWSLLVLYSFLAGFSEKLVSDSLTKVEATMSGKK